MKEGQTVLRRRRPRMTSDSLKNLLRRHGKEIADEADAEEDAKDKRNAGGAGTSESRE